MLKIYVLNIFFIALFSKMDWEQPVSYIIAVVGGLIGVSGYKYEQNTLTKKSLIVHLCYTLSMAVMVFELYTKDITIFGIHISKAAALFFTTLTANILVKNLLSFIKHIYENYFKKQLGNEDNRGT